MPGPTVLSMNLARGAPTIVAFLRATLRRSFGRPFSAVPALIISYFKEILLSAFVQLWNIHIIPDRIAHSKHLLSTLLHAMRQMNAKIRSF